LPRNRLTNETPRSEYASGITEHMKKLIIAVVIVAVVAAVIAVLITKILGLGDSAPIAGGVAGGVASGWVVMTGKYPMKK
jgi:Flp pilus assembly protein TadB